MINDNTLSRFLSAQQNIYPQVIKELHNGNKATHWMWFIFPQIEGLGLSSTSKYYSIKSISEAKEYSSHPVLGARLKECCSILLNLNNTSAKQIFGSTDELKLRSSMTLFNYVNTGNKIFENVLQKYFSGEEDQKTILILQEKKIAETEAK